MTGPEDENEDLHEPEPEPEWQPTEEDRRVMRGVVPMWSTDGKEV